MTRHALITSYTPTLAAALRDLYPDDLVDNWVRVQSATKARDPLTLAAARGFVADQQRPTTDVDQTMSDLAADGYDLGDHDMTAAVDGTLAGPGPRLDLAITTAVAVGAAIIATLNDRIAKTLTDNSADNIPDAIATLWTATDYPDWVRDRIDGALTDPITQGQVASAEANNIEHVQLVASEGDCDFCAGYDGRILTLPDDESGLPPLHNNCLCDIAPLSEETSKMTTATLFAPIVTKTLDDDGTMTVYGKLTGPDLDLDGQIADPEWLKTAVPAWFEIGNIREMHQPKAVGKAIDLEQDGDDYYISAKIVDPGSIAKVQHEVLTGFSIGVSQPKIVKDSAAPNGRINGGVIVESSLADRPCNETCKLILAKTAGGTLEQVEELTEIPQSDTETIVPKDATLTKDAGETIGVDGSVGDEENLDPADAIDETAEADLVALARQALVALLDDEVDELADGGGLSPIAILIDLLSDLAWFEECDAYDDARQMAAAMKAALATPTTTEEAPVELVTITKLIEAASAADATDADKDQVANLRKALGLTEPDAATKTAEPSKEVLAKLEDLEGRLVKVEESPAGVLPVLATGKGATLHDPHEAERAEIARLNKAANQATDPAIAAGYRARAQTLQTSLDDA